MPANSRSLELTDAYRRQLLSLRVRTNQVVVRSWQLDPAALEQSFAGWHDTATTLTTAAQAQGVLATQAYLASYLGSETGRAQTIDPVDPARYVGLSRDGRPLGELFTPPLYTVKLSLAQGLPFLRASQMGRARAMRSVNFEVLEAARSSLDDSMRTNRRVVGWRRVPAGSACGACLAAATGAIQDTDATLLVHRGCACTKEPVVRDVKERVHRPTGEQQFRSLTEPQQDALFAGRGGAEKAQLIRDGLPFSALITHEHEHLGDDTFTETPLDAL